MLRFATPLALESAAELRAHQREQVRAFGPLLDGMALTAEQRFAAGWYAPSLCEVVDAGGRARYEIWTCDVDSGAVFRAGTTTLVGMIVQGGFACPDLAVWTELAGATLPDQDDCGVCRVSWALSEDGGPILYRLDADSVALDEAHALELGPAWPVLVEAVAGWDSDGSLRGLITASGGSPSNTLSGLYGPAKVFDAAAVASLAAAIAKLPNDAVARVAQPLAAIERLDLPTDGIDVEWLSDRLAALRDWIVAAATASQGLAVTVV